MSLRNKNSLLKELDNYLKNSREFAPHYAKHKHHVFIRWFIKAHYGKSQFLLTDGPNDGGIDAIIERPDSIVIIQSKYDTTFKDKIIHNNDLLAFEQVKEIFTNRALDNQFNNYISKVKIDWRSNYQSIRKSFLSGKKEPIFIFITTSNSNSKKENQITFKCMSSTNIIQLWNNYQEGHTPLIDSININLKNSWNIKDSSGRYITYVGLVDLAEFMRIMDSDPDRRLFAKNVRTDLKSSINREISTTYRTDPSSFWLGHNGIYIIASKVLTEGGSNYKVFYPSVVNGSQTLHSIHSTGLKNHCDILVRILVIDGIEQRELLEKVIKRTNTQNAMKVENLAAHDPAQYHLYSFLNRYKIFYERREREWKNEYEKQLKSVGYIKLGIKDLAKYLATTHISISTSSKLGFGTIRSNVKSLIDPSFKENFYSKIFNQFSSNYEVTQYKDLVAVIWSAMFVLGIQRRIPKTKRRAFKISNLLFIRMIFDAIKVQKKSTLIHRKLENHDFGNGLKKDIIEKIINQIVLILNNTIDYETTLKKKDPSEEYSNIFKSDTKTKTIYNKFFVNQGDKIVKLIS
jgi:hypothetical protein